MRTTNDDGPPHSNCPTICCAWKKALFIRLLQRIDLNGWMEGEWGLSATRRRAHSYARHISCWVLWGESGMRFNQSGESSLGTAVTSKPKTRQFNSL
ncbi:MAG: hypothetical protein ACLP59_24360 [Bryobacteraceae bacterium]